MTALTRYGQTSAGGWGQVDNLTFSYNGTNQLYNVNDAAANTTLNTSYDFINYRTGTDREYTYNRNGAMTQDLNKGISEIAYNPVNLPATVDIKMAEKKPWLSPYVYCLNNPLNRIDPDGRHDYQLNYETGNINLIKETKANTHTIYAPKVNGKIDRGNSITVSQDVLNTSTKQTTQVNGESFTTSTYTIFNSEQAKSNIK
jgi:hypothetical protein